MNFGAKIALGVLGILAISGVYVWDEKASERETAEKKSNSKGLDFETQDLRKISLENSEGKFVFERTSSTDPWKMLEPKSVRPDQDAINNLVAALSATRLESQTAIEKDSAGNNQKFGFEKPRFSVTLYLGNKPSQSLIVGDDIQIGTKDGGTLQALSVYAKTGARKNVLILESNFVAALKKGLKDFRTKLATDFAVSDVNSYSLSQNGQSKIELSRAESAWKIISPTEFPTDSNSASLYLDKLSRLRVVSVIESEAATPEKIKSIGMESPPLIVEVKGKENKVIQTIKFSLTPEAVFVTMADGAYGTLDVNSWADFAQTLKSFRDRRVLRGVKLGNVSKIRLASGATFQKEGENWYAIGGSMDNAKTTEPSATPVAAGAAAVPAKASSQPAAAFFADWEFMSADEIIEGAEAQNLNAFGFDKPIARFYFEGADSTQLSEEILVGNRVPKNEKSVYIKRATQPEIYIVEAGWLEKLTALGGASQNPQSNK